MSAQLRQDLAAARQQQHDSTAQWEDACGRLQEQLEAQGAELQRLHAELAARPTAARVAELQQQVRVLQAVGYGSLPEEDLGAAAEAAAAEAAAAAAAAGVDPAAARVSSSSSAGGGLDHRGSLELGAGGAGGSEPRLPGAASGGLLPGGLNLEGLLLAKNRKLEHEVTVARLAAAEARQQLEAAQEQVSELQEQLQQKTGLIAQLEDDLCSIRQGGGSSSNSAAAVAAAALAGGGLDLSSSSGGAADGRRLSAGLGSGELGRFGSGAAAAGASGDWGEAAAPAEGGSDTMLRVLVGQRDRLRARVQELDVALAAAQAEGAAAAQQLAAARADNVALIERLRYVGGYRQQMAAGGGGGKGGGRDVEAGVGGGGSAAGGEVVGRYSALYDEGINPFKEFQVCFGVRAPAPGLSPLAPLVLQSKPTHPHLHLCHTKTGPAAGAEAQADEGS